MGELSFLTLFYFKASLHQIKVLLLQISRKHHQSFFLQMRSKHTNNNSFISKYHLTVDDNDLIDIFQYWMSFRATSLGSTLSFGKTRNF